MKLLKLSKVSWLILSAGVFIVVLGSLGIARSQQIQEKGTLDEELRISTNRLEGLQTSLGSRERLDALQQRIEEEQLLLDEARKRLDQTVVSVDVADELFAIADYCGIIITGASTTEIRATDYEGISVETTAINVAVSGELPNLVAFIHSLNNDYTTGLVETFQINIPDPANTTQKPSANIRLSIYSYEDKKNG